MKAPLNKLREVVTRSPGDANGWYTLGVKAIESGDLAEAGPALLTFVKLAPREIDRALSAGYALLAAGCHAEAEQIFRLTSEQAPSRTNAQLGLARVFIETGRESDAVGLLSRVLLADASSVEAHLLAASAYERMGLLADATDHLALVLAVDSNHSEATSRLGNALGQLGDNRGLIRCLRRLVALNGDQDLEARTMLGIALSGNGQHDEAVEVLQAVATARATVSSAYADLGMAQLTAERLEEAIATMSQALKLDPRSAQAYCGLGLCYQKVGRWKEAAQAFASTEQLAPELSVGPLNLGLALDALGDKTGARRALLRAAALDPTDEEIRQALERLFIGALDGPTDAGVAQTLSGPGSISGELRNFPFLDVLEFLRLQNRTGTLVVTSQRGAGAVRLTRGQISSASAPNTKRFDHALFEMGLISRGNLEAVVARSPGLDRESAEALGTALLRERAVEHRPLSQLLSRRIHESLVEILSWTEGAFSFHPEEHRDPPAIFFNLQDVMLELVRVSDERRHGIQGPAH